MLTALIVATSIIAYISVGAVLARKLTTAYLAHKMAHPDSEFEDLAEKWANRGARSLAATTLFLWPFVLPTVGVWLMLPALTGENPWAKKRDLEQRERRIRQLERELGVGP